MPKIIMLKGLPASGKSTWAKKFLSQQPIGNWKRINKDDLRAMLDDSKWSKSNEELIIQARDLLVTLALSKGKSVIVDDTNFSPKHEVTLRDLAMRFNADFEVKVFDVPLKEAIARDLKRPNSVGADVIKRMFYENLPKPKLNKEGKKAVICDLDGTLAEISHRSPYDASGCEQDGVNTFLASCLDSLRENGYTLIFTSGREDKWRTQTENWLNKNMAAPFELLMRKAGDPRMDAIVKKEIFEKEINPSYTVDLVFDDRDQVVDMWRSIGLTCWQVANGNF